MADIVERLRRLEVNPFSTHPKGMLEEAADEIERLRAHLKTAIWSDSEECKLLTADNERLRAALEKIEYLDRPQVRGLPRRVSIQEIATTALAQEKHDDAS